MAPCLSTYLRLLHHLLDARPLSTNRPGRSRGLLRRGSSKVRRIEAGESLLRLRCRGANISFFAICTLFGGVIPRRRLLRSGSRAPNRLQPDAHSLSSLHVRLTGSRANANRASQAMKHLLLATVLCVITVSRSLAQNQAPAVPTKDQPIDLPMSVLLGRGWVITADGPSLGVVLHDPASGKWVRCAFNDGSMKGSLSTSRCWLID